MTRRGFASGEASAAPRQPRRRRLLSAERSGAVGEQALAGAAAQPGAAQAAADAHWQQAAPADRLCDCRLIRELVEQAMQRRLVDGGAIICDETLDHPGLAQLCERGGRA